MAAYVLGEGLNGYVDPVAEGVEEDPGCPRIVQGYGDSTAMCRLHNPGNVLHLHRVRSRTFTPNQSCVRPNEVFDRPAGWVELNLNPISSENTSGKGTT